MAMTYPQNSNLREEIMTFLKSELEMTFKNLPKIEDAKSVQIFTDERSQYISRQILEKVENPLRDKKLTILYNHEKHFLDILKDYKEEIKFASSLQADIRKEEATFFASTLKEVCNSLKETQVDPKFQAQWIFDLVSSYTSSLRLSSKLAEEHIINLIGEIQKEASETINEK